MVSSLSLFMWRTLNFCVILLITFVLHIFQYFFEFGFSVELLVLSLLCLQNSLMDTDFNVLKIYQKLF